MNKKYFLLISIFFTSLITSCTTIKDNYMSTGIPSKSLDYYCLKDNGKNTYVNQDSKFILIDNNLVHYRDQGQGEVIILLHGFADSLHTWDGWVDKLYNNYRIIRLDILGFGLTGPTPSNNYSRDLWVNFLNKFTEKLNLKSFYLVGNSLGGFISWNYTIDYPEKVKKLILLDPVGYPQDVPWIVNFASNIFVRSIAKYVMPKFFIKLCLKEVSFDQSKVTEDIVNHYFGLALRKGNKASYIEICRLFKQNCKNQNPSLKIKNIRVPTFLIWGEQDKWVPVDLVNKWIKDLPDAYVKIYKNAGHIPMQEIPEQTVKDAENFLKGSTDLSSINYDFYKK